MPHVTSSGDLLASGAAQTSLHGRAREAAMAHFGHRVFVRAVVEVSNYCRENCLYCGMRRENKGLARYRARAEQLAELLVHHRPPSVTDVNLQAGEDPIAVREIVLPLIRELRSRTNLGISVCLGTLNSAAYAALLEAGASVYIMKFESAESALYAELQAPGTLAERLAHIRTLAGEGWSVSSGFIAGLRASSPSAEDLWAAVELATTLPLVGCSVSPFIPGEATPLSNRLAGNIDATLNSMAVLRLARPDWVIPAVSALNLADPGEGYRRGLRTGANLVTINMTPEEVRGDYLLYKRDRLIMTEERILSAIASEGLHPSSSSLASHFTASSRTREPVLRA